MLVSHLVLTAVGKGRVAIHHNSVRESFLQHEYPVFPVSALIPTVPGQFDSTGILAPETSLMASDRIALTTAKSLGESLVPCDLNFC